MRVQWMVPGLPTTAFQAGTHDLHFGGTVGWCWEEAVWAGKFTGPNDQLVIGADVEMPDAVVISPEGLVAQYMSALMSAPKSVSVYLRSCSGPSVVNGVPTSTPPNSVWLAIEPLVSRLKGISVWSEFEKAPTERWARRAGYRGEVQIVTPGAVVIPPSGGPREGVAFLGRPFFAEKGIDVLLEAARRLPAVPFYFATPTGTDMASVIEMRKQIDEVPNAHATTCGIRGRAALLQNVRIAAVRGTTDWRWLPGAEIRGAHGVAIAGKGTTCERWNGDELTYFRDLNHLVELIRRYHEDDAAFEVEATRQHEKFLALGLDSDTVGRKLWEWVHG